MRAILLAILIGSVGIAHGISVFINVQQYPNCWQQGNMEAMVQGGVAPYSYTWFEGVPGSDPIGTGQFYNGAQGGNTYFVEVTDDLGNTAIAEVFLDDMMYGDLHWLPNCPGSAYPYQLIGLSVPEQFIPPYSVSNGLSISHYAFQVGEPTDFRVFTFAPPYPAPGSYLSFSVTDGSGCSSTYTGWVPTAGAPQWPPAQVLSVSPACQGGPNGGLQALVPADVNLWGRRIRIVLPDGSLLSNINNAVSDLVLNYTTLVPGTYQVIIDQSWQHISPFGPDLYSTMYPGMPCADTTTIVIPDMDSGCGNISGKVFVDVDENCAQGSLSQEPGIPGVILEVQPGDHFTITTLQGNYSLNLPLGNYTITQQNSQYQEHCGVDGDAFELTNVLPFVVRNFADTSLMALDLEASMASGFARPGFQLSYSLRVKNLTATASGSGTVTMTFDPLLTFQSSTPPPTTTAPGMLTWNLASITAFQARNFYPKFMVPDDVGLLDTELLSSVTISTVVADADPTNNTALHSVIITGSYDPNDKLARTSTNYSISEYYIGEDEWIDYTIRFQNTGTDTAFFVVITDTLASTLDLATLILGASSHVNTVTLNDRTLSFHFANIQLPDSNVNEPGSHGFVSFRIRPHLPLPGMEIINIANIYFDYNPPVITDPSILEATMSTTVPASTIGTMPVVHPQPSSGLFWITGLEHDVALEHMRVFSNDGRLVHQQRITSDQRNFNLKDLARGQYVLEFLQREGTPMRTKLILE